MEDIYKVIISLCRNKNHCTITSEKLNSINKHSEWDSFIKLATDHSVLPVVYESLEKNYKAELPEKVISELKDKYLQISINNINKTKELVKIYELLYHNRIEALTFKGPSLALQSYGNITLRQYVDIDFIVDQKDIVAAKMLLQENGYHPQFNIKNKYKDIYLYHWHYENFYSDEAANAVDLHWRSSKPVYSFSIDFKDFKEKSFSLKIFDSEVKTFSNEINLIFLCQHGCKHGWELITWVLDLHKHILSAENIDWEFTFEKAAEFNSLNMLKTGLLLTHRIFKTDIPDNIKNLIYSDKKLAKLTSDFFISAYCGRAKKNILFLKPSDLFYLKTMSNYKDRIFYVISFFSVTPLEWKLDLPVNLYFLYYIYRPFRLLKRKILNK